MHEQMNEETNQELSKRLGPVTARVEVLLHLLTLTERLRLLFCFSKAHLF